MNIRKTLLTTILLASSYAAGDNVMDNFCPLSRVVIDILKNCQDVESCKHSCHMIYNIILAGSADTPFEDSMESYGMNETYCDSIDESNLSITKAWANALVETAEYNRTAENC